MPEGGIGRVLIYKTYKDPRTYMMNGKDIVWVRSLAGYRLGVVLPKGFAFISSNVAAQMTTTADGRLKLAFANPSGQSNPVTIHARPTTAAFTPSTFDDMFFDDIKTLYDLDAPETGRIAVEQTYSDYRKGEQRAARLARLPGAAGSQGRRSRHGEAVHAGQGSEGHVREARRADHERQAERAPPDHRHAQGVRLHSSSTASSCSSARCKGLRNTVLLPKGWEVSGVSQSGTIGTERASGRAFVSLINLNAENTYNVTIRARKSAS